MGFKRNKAKKEIVDTTIESFPISTGSKTCVATLRVISKKMN
jgi:hypothetical protein